LESSTLSEDPLEALEERRKQTFVLQKQSSFVPLQFYSKLAHFASKEKAEIELAKKVTARQLKSNNSLLDLQSIKIKQQINKLN
jgi:hypothetical protein